MTAKIIPFTGVSIADVDPSRVLHEAAANEFEDVLVIGKATSGEMYIAASTADVGTILLLMEITRARLIEELDQP